MHAIEHLEERKWTHPSDYGGFSPDGDYIIVSRTRDSNCLEESNYFTAFNSLKRVAEPFRTPPEAPNEIWRDWVYDFRAGHWACGWVEYLLVRADAPDEILEAAGEIVCSLADYPVLDEEDLSEREVEAVMTYWRGLPNKWRLDEWKRCRSPYSSYLGIRRDSLPHEDENLFDHLRNGL